MQSRLLWAHMTAKLGNTNTTLEGEKSKHELRCFSNYQMFPIHLETLIKLVYLFNPGPHLMHESRP